MNVGNRRLFVGHQDAYHQTHCSKTAQDTLVLCPWLQKNLLLFLVNFLDIGFLVRYGISMNLRANERRSAYSQVSHFSMNDHASLSDIFFHAPPPPSKIRAKLASFASEIKIFLTVYLPVTFCTALLRTLMLSIHHFHPILFHLEVNYGRL
jgi:hypothetical protein